MTKDRTSCFQRKLYAMYVVYLYVYLLLPFIKILHFRMFKNYIIYSYPFKSSDYNLGFYSLKLQICAGINLSLL